MNKILIIEDDQPIIDVLKMILEQDGYEVQYALNGFTGIDRFKSFVPDVVLLDIKMPRKDGIEVLDEIKKLDKESIVIMISGHGNIETAVQTTKLGAYDFISKPFDVDRLKLTIENGLNYKKLLLENKKMRRLIESDDTLTGSSEAIKKLKEIIQKVAATSSTVLVTGENGTGKELAAREIHKLSARRHGPFIEVNCAAIPTEMIEVELFGNVENYLSYSPMRRTGKFELASGGTIFLDEIGDLDLEAQGKLLRVLGENRIEPLGSGGFVPIDVRIIASTNKNLPELIEQRKFREDLYHRINVLTVHVPPLRERRHDIPELIEYFAEFITRKNNLPKKRFTKGAIDYLRSLKWQGNVRELRNTIERLIILSGKDVIDKSSFEAGGAKFISDFDRIINSPISLHDFQDQSEKIFIQKKLEENGWNISKTAEILGIQRSHLYTKIKQFGIEVSEKS